MKTLLASITAISALTLLAWPIALILTIIMFDAPGSDSNLATVATALLFFLYPATIMRWFLFW